MQRSIDSFFKRAAPKTPSDSGGHDEIKTKKRKARIIISSDEDEDAIAVSPNVTSKKSRNNNDVSPPKKKREPVDPEALFGGDTVRVAAKKLERPKDKAFLELEDDEINNSLIDVDVDHVTVPLPQQKSPTKTPNKKATELDRKNTSPNENKKEIPKSEVKSNGTPKTEKKQPAKEKTPRIKKEQQTDLETSVISDEERFERRRFAAQAYKQYKNRPAAFNPGSKEVPKGKPDCFSGLTFLKTGILESLDHETLTAIVLECGGKMMTTAGKRLSYLIAGSEPGYKKLEQAKTNGTRIISEDDFLDLIKEKSGMTVRKAEEKPSISPKKPKTKEEKSSPPSSKKFKKDEKSPEPRKKDKEHNSSKSPLMKKEKTSPNSKSAKIEPEVLKDSPQKVLSSHQAAAAPKVAEENLALVDKYKPASVKDIIGQQGPASNVAKLTHWLSRWYSNHDGKKKLLKPSPWAKNDDGAYFKAVLLSGPPGIGKTTTATLVTKELGFDAVEFNASDTRSKRLLKEEVSELLSNKSLYGYFHNNAQAVTKKHVLIMDEVDGMAGNEDRGGIQELIALIKDSSIPIICMCNDRNHQKMRSLVNYCFDLRFARPRLEQIKGRILSICCKEGIKLDSAKVDEIISSTNNDIRQSINHIALLSAHGAEDILQTSNSKKAGKSALKDLKIGPWEVVRKVFSIEEHKHMSLYDKSDLFFHDYSLSPLFVHQNYLSVTPAGPKSEILQKVAMTANTLSVGDRIEKLIRTESAWSLLPALAMVSSVMPGEYMAGHFTGQINFPAWLGKYARTNKRNRLAQEIHDHTRVRTSASKLSIRLEYTPFLLDKIVRPLQQHGTEGIEESLKVMQEYHLLREDIESLIELSSWPGRKNPMDSVDGRVKAALTRAYNKDTLAYSYSATAGVKKKRAATAADDEEGGMLAIDGEDDDVVNSGEDDDDTLENDALIKAKKKSAPSKTSSSSAKTKTTAAKGTAVNRSKPAVSKPKK